MNSHYTLRQHKLNIFKARKFPCGCKFNKFSISVLRRTVYIINKTSIPSFKTLFRVLNILHRVYLCSSLKIIITFMGISLT